MQIVLDDSGPQLAQLQKAAYPDVVPIMTTLPVAMAFSEALDVATSMPGWTIVASDIDAGRIEAEPLVRLHRRYRHQGRHRRGGKPHRRALHQPPGSE